jgi:hypothetical protein
MEQWSNGAMERWSDGAMERWSIESPFLSSSLEERIRGEESDFYLLLTRASPARRLLAKTLRGVRLSDF